MSYYMFDKCNESDLINLEAIVDVMGLDEVRCPPGRRQWQSKNSYPIMAYQYGAKMPVMLQIKPSKTHLNDQKTKQMILDVMYALDVINVYKPDGTPYDFNEF